MTHLIAEAARALGVLWLGRREDVKGAEVMAQRLSRKRRTCGSFRPGSERVHPSLWDTPSYMFPWIATVRDQAVILF